MKRTKAFLLNSMLILSLVPLLGSSGGGCSECPDKQGNSIELNIFGPGMTGFMLDSVVLLERNNKLYGGDDMALDVEKNHSTFILFSPSKVDTLYLIYKSTINYRRNMEGCGMQYYITEFKASSTFRKTASEIKDVNLQKWTINLYQ